LVRPKENKLTLLFLGQAATCQTINHPKVETSC